MDIIQQITNPSENMGSLSQTAHEEEEAKFIRPLILFNLLTQL